MVSDAWGLTRPAEFISPLIIFQVVLIMLSQPEIIESGHILGSHYKSFLKRLKVCLNVVFADNRDNY